MRPKNDRATSPEFSRSAHPPTFHPHSPRDCLRNPLRRREQTAGVVPADALSLQHPDESSAEQGPVTPFPALQPLPAPVKAQARTIGRPFLFRLALPLTSLSLLPSFRPPSSAAKDLKRPLSTATVVPFFHVHSFGNDLVSLWTPYTPSSQQHLAADSHYYLPSPSWSFSLHRITHRDIPQIPVEPLLPQTTSQPFQGDSPALLLSNHTSSPESLTDQVTAVLPRAGSRYLTTTASPYIYHDFRLPSTTIFGRLQPLTVKTIRDKGM